MAEENVDITVVNPEAVSIETEDGGMLIDFDPTSMDEEIPFDADLSEFLTEKDLSFLGHELVSAFESDKDSRSDWERTYTEGLDNLGLKISHNRNIPSSRSCTN